MDIFSFEKKAGQTTGWLYRKDMSLFDTLKKIAAAHGAGSMHIHLTNDLTVPSQVEIIATIPLDETKPVRMPTSN